MVLLIELTRNEYKISEADFKNLHPNDFEDLYLLHLQSKLNYLPRSDKVHLYNAINLWIRNIVIRQRVRDLQLGIESYQTKLNLTEPRWGASDFLFKEYYTIVSKPRAMIYIDRNDQKKMLRENEVHKFSDGTLTRVLHKLDHTVKDFRLYLYNPGMEYRIWSEDDKRRSEEFMENIQVIPEYHGEDGNPARANIKPALGRDKFITACSYLTNSFNEIIKAQADVSKLLYEHVGSLDTRPQDVERSQDDDQRLDLADDLKKAQDHISSSITSHKTKITTSKYKISHEESRLRAEHKISQKITELKRINKNAMKESNVFGNNKSDDCSMRIIIR
uniref:Uncharacterized protein n=1 Tax=Tanacetum cinerariifolium TaxID=118510 RepID=A0A699GSM3_TANCI|nr:hypothetical protein [Tanacetum cinerariifolium]